MKKFTCRKCRNHTYRKRQYKIKGKSMTDYRHKLTNQCPLAFKKLDDKVMCLKCGHAQKL